MIAARAARATRLVDPRGWDLRRVVAGVAWAVAIVALAAMAWIWAGQRFGAPPVSFTSTPVMIGEIVLAAAYATVGWILASRRPRNFVGWAFIGIGVSTALQLPVMVLVAQAHQVLRAVPTPTLYAAWLASSAHVPFAAALAITVFAVFPGGRLPRGRSLIPIGSAVAGMVVVACAAAISPSGLLWYPSLANPFAAPATAAPAVAATSVGGAVFGIAGLVLVVVGMVRRYQCADLVVRAQLRWIVYAIVLMALTGIPFLAVRYAVGGSGVVGSALVLGMVVAASFLPFASAAAILRYRLFDIDLIINRTLVYVPLVAFLGGLFTASITLSQRLFIGMTGNTSDIAVVLATLLAASAITPVRHGLETLVDRHVKPPLTARPLTQEVASASPFVPVVQPVLEASGYVTPTSAATAPSATDLAEVVARLNERIATLEERLTAVDAPAAMEPAVEDRR